jgi:glycosyltransferase involved in cell wall biosynthesis
MYITSLRPYAVKRLEELSAADILVGIPCYNNEPTIQHVIQMTTHGLDRHFRDARSVIFVSDGGSTDDSREVAKEFQIKPWQEKLISIYRGPAGKGSALRSIFEAAVRLNVKACAVVDSDLRSITSDWVKRLLDPILERDYQFVAPVYLRHKYDGTITNNVVYNLIRTLYGKRIRQPIGGDFAFSGDVAAHYISQPVWDTDVARFGIDVWMTTEAITQGFKVCQANLGVKIHDAKDPAAHLGPMFRQVTWTVFHLMEEHEEFWRKISGSEPVKTYGEVEEVEPEPVTVNLEALVNQFQVGYAQFAPFWKTVFKPETFQVIALAAGLPAAEFRLPVLGWVHILYDLAAAFHHWPMHQRQLLDVVSPLYKARVASFINETLEMTSAEAELAVERQAKAFEENKGYLLEVWKHNGLEESPGVLECASPPAGRAGR